MKPHRAPTVALLCLAASVSAACGAKTALGVAEVDASDAPRPECFTTLIVTLATDQSPDGIALDGDYVYWKNDSPDVIRRVRKTGGPVEDVASIPEGGYTGFGLTIDGDWIYTGETELYRVPKAGGPATLVAAEPGVNDVALDATSVYWARLNGFSGDVRVAPKGGGPARELVATKGGTTRLVLDDAYVYYTTWFQPDDGVWRVKKTGGPAERLARGAQSNDLALDDTTLYWTVQWSPSGPAGIFSVPKGGGTATMLAPASSPHGLAIDDAFVYWTGDDDQVQKVPKAGGTVHGVALFQWNVSAIAVDDVCAYWVIPTGPGEIHVAPK